MDFDSILTFLFILFFFILPSILKQIRRAKNGKTNNKSLFGKITSRIRMVIEEIEEQKKQQQKAHTEPDDVWQTLIDEEEQPLNHDFVFKEDMPVKEEVIVKKEPAIPLQEAVQETDATLKPEKHIRKADAIVQESIEQGSSTADYRGFDMKKRTNALQNAVIWSEILGKPVALRQNV